MTDGWKGEGRAGEAWWSLSTPHKCPVMTIEGRGDKARQNKAHHDTQMAVIKNGRRANRELKSSTYM
jgi:hypothetical protein